ncbi:14219_t:CDS:2 [Entrophospora sp. SA101]|nr:14219_t:CDS:2 [Entrophospora sp. SA101]
MEIGLPLIKDEIDKNLRILGAFISSDQTSQAEDNDNDTNDDIISFNPKNNNRNLVDGESSESIVVSITDDQVVICLDPPNKLLYKTYFFDRVFGKDMNQQMVFDSVAYPMLEDVLKGFNCTLFAYGQTSTVKVSYVELYNEELKDLLSDNDRDKLIVSMRGLKNHKEIDINNANCNVPTPCKFSSNDSYALLKHPPKVISGGGNHPALITYNGELWMTGSDIDGQCGNIIINDETNSDHSNRFYNCLQQIGTKINLTSDDKWEVLRLYYSTLSTLSEESSISQAVRKKMEAEKKDFMEEDTNEIAEEKDETTDEYACIENEVFDVENNEGDELDAIYRTRRWILSSGTDVGQILSEYRQKIPESQKSDKLLEFGFLEQTDKIFAACSSPKLQMALFNATLPSGVKKDPIRNVATETFKQKFVYVGQEGGKLIAVYQLI